MAGGSTGEERADSHCGKHQTRGDGREADGGDEVQRNDEHERKLANGHHEGGEVTPGEGGVTEHRKVQQHSVLGATASEFSDDEAGQRHGRDNECDACRGNPVGGPVQGAQVEVLQGLPPTELGSFNDAEHEGTEADCGQQESEEVSAVGGACTRARFRLSGGVGDEGQGEEDQANAEWDVDPEDPLPARIFGQHTSKQRADSGRLSSS